jgi:proteasome alpha subunit
MYPSTGQQAYDRGVMFSPDGRLYQVDYAREAVRRGATSIGIVALDSVVLLAHKNLNEQLAIPNTVQKIFKIDASIGVTYSGMVSDALHLVDVMRSRTQSHRMIYDETESVESITREVASELQLATQYGGVRPYGVSVLIGGYDKGPKLYEIDAGGPFLGYKADAIGAGKKIAEEILVRDYKDGMDLEDAIALGLACLKKVSEKKLVEDNLDISTITKDEGFRMFQSDEIAKHL